MPFPDLVQKNPPVFRDLGNPGVNLQIKNYFWSFVYHALQMMSTQFFISLSLQLYSPKGRSFRGFIYLSNALFCFDVQYRVNCSFWTALYLWWIIMNKVFPMNGVQWDQTRWGKATPLSSLFLSVKEGKRPMCLKRQQCLPGQHVQKTLKLGFEKQRSILNVKAKFLDTFMSKGVSTALYWGRWCSEYWQECAGRSGSLN